MSHEDVRRKFTISKFWGISKRTLYPGDKHVRTMKIFKISVCSSLSH